MPNFEVDFEYSIREGGSTNVNADDAQDAEREAENYINDVFGDVEDVEITAVREIKD